MKKQLQLLSMTLLTLLVVGCNKQQGSNNAATEDVSLASEVALKACSSEASKNVEILGLDKVVADKKSRLTLSESVNCDDAKLAVWKVGSVVIGTGPSIDAEFIGSGNYVVSVEIPKAANLSNQKVNAKAAIDSETLVVQESLTVSNSGIAVSAPQAGTEGYSYNFSVVIPAGVEVVAVEWNFNDGSAPISSLNPVPYSFIEGIYTVGVKVTKAGGAIENLSHQITILPVPDGKFCPLDQLSIVGASEIPVQRSTEFSVSISTCLSTIIKSVEWDFGDGTNPQTGSTVNHTYANPGAFEITASVSLYGTSITLVRSVVVKENLETIPGPTPAPNPNRCSTFGSTRVLDGATSEEQVACGLDGKKLMSYIEKVNQSCQLVGEGLEWVTTSTDKALVSEGACLGQSCTLVTEAGQEKLADGASKSLFTNNSPANSCSEVQQTRTCANGVLSGSETAKYLTCNSGCGDFGVHGTKVIGVVVGSVTVPVTCSNGETGVTSTYQQIADKACENGQVNTTNTRTGDITSAGSCPVYSWVATEQYTACTQACGGEQRRIYECKNDKGELSDAARCSGSAPVETKVCDGNPESVFSSVTTVTKEEAPSCATCPKNQIGVVVKERQVTTTDVVACVNHSIQSTKTVVNGPWVEESYCRDLTPSRCSKDSLSNAQAHGRYDWMVKCQNQVPVIKEFLTTFEDVKSKGFGLDTPGRVLYPTFMDSKTKTVWKAPVKGSDSCEVAATVYVAGVCVSSCATPEQQIMVEHNNKVQNMSFIDALTQKVGAVKTLQSDSSMSSKTLATTKVDSWVTELEDTDHEILVFKMKSGGELKLTVNHPILSQDGVMKLSADFKVGESLVQVGGKLDPIVSITKVPYFGKVYNVFVKSSALQKNVVITNGYLNGTAFYQNEGAKHMNRALFREQLFRGAFPESKK